MSKGYGCAFGCVDAIEKLISWGETALAADLLQTMARMLENPRNPEHEELREWAHRRLAEL